MMRTWRVDLKRVWTEWLEEEDDENFNDWLVSEVEVFSDEEREKTRHGGSRPGKKPNLQRQRSAGHSRMFLDYFAINPVYDSRLFRRRFRMRRELFLKIQDAVVSHDSYFRQKADALGVLGLSSEQKLTAAIRMLAYGYGADSCDEYCRIGESTASESMKKFCNAVIEIFGPEFLRNPTMTNIVHQEAINSQRGFPGMFASIDCMHWQWKNCPVAWAGQFQGKDGHRSIVLEAIADKSLRFWHTYFGLPGSNNDLNVLDRSPLVQNLLTTENFATGYTVNNKRYNRMYLLADGIYPDLSVFVKTIHEPQGEKRCHFAKMQESLRKDVERAFGVLQARWAIIRNPARQWDQHTIKQIMLACVVLHNMIVEDEKSDASLNHDYLFEGSNLPPLNRTKTFEFLLKSTKEIENKQIHNQLRSDLIDHLWTLKGLAM